MDLKLYYKTFIFLLAFTFIKLLIEFDLLNIERIFFKSKTPNNYCEIFFKDERQYRVKIDDDIYPKSVSLFKNKSIDFKCLSENAQLKTILLWNDFFGFANYSYGIGVREPFIDNKCPIINCELTANKSKLNSSSLVITHMRGIIDPIPNYRPLNQRWLFLLYESPFHANEFVTIDNYRNYSNVYNLTSTYKVNSHFPTFYEDQSRMVWKKNLLFNKNYDYHAHKHKFAVALISNCGGTSNRIGYINNLKNYIDVDVFGKCGMSCDFDLNKSSHTKNCKQALSKDYKFYLAFENSNCKDYLTEKFFEILQYDIIPVVMGGGNYAHYVRKK